MRRSSVPNIFLTLRWKLFYVVAAIVLLMGVLSIVLGSTMNRALQREHDNKGAALAGNIAAMSTEHVLIDSPTTLASMLQNAMETDDEIVYLFVLDKHGEVIAHTFGGAFPADLLDVVRSRPNTPSKSPGFLTEKGIVADFTAPIMEGMAGSLHIGLSERKVMERIGETRGRMVMVTAAFLVGGLVASHLLAAYFTRPLHDLTLAAREIGMGNLDRRIRARSRDEVALLSAAFNGMAEALQSNLNARKEAEESLRKAHDELEHRVRERTSELAAANQELEAFSYSVSHDLRAPLRSIDGFSLALLQDHSHRIDEAGKSHLLRIRSGCASMNGLIDNLLKLSRLTQAEIRKEAVDLGVLARSILEDLRESSPERRVEVDVAPGMLVQGDPMLLRIALENLLRNAWKFTRKIADPKIEFGFRPGNGKPVYFVRDNGVGFDMEYADKLFGAFQRLHSASEYEGSGIGLATVKRIVRRHGGNVWAEAKVGKGATFYFTLGDGPSSA